MPLFHTNALTAVPCKSLPVFFESAFLTLDLHHFLSFFKLVISDLLELNIKKTFPLIVFSRWPFPAVAGVAWPVTMMLRWVCLNFVFFKVFWELSIKYSVYFNSMLKACSLRWSIGSISWKQYDNSFRCFLKRFDIFEINALHIEFCPQRSKSLLARGPYAQNSYNLMYNLHPLFGFSFWCNTKVLGGGSDNFCCGLVPVSALIAF